MLTIPEAGATKEYQTSSSAVPPQGLASGDALEQLTVPLTMLVQEAPELIGTFVAEEHSLFDGTGAVLETEQVDEFEDSPLAEHVTTQR
jgi:hypothetical protein